MIYIYNDLESFSENDYLWLLEKVPEQRADKCRRYRFFADQRTSLIAYLLLLWGAGREYGIRGNIHLHTEKNGKPYAHIPGLCFSLSHSREGVMCCVDSLDVGCDVEYTAKELFFPKYVFSREEYELVCSCPKPEAAFTKLWTLKEAYAKCLGTGLADDQISCARLAAGLERPCFSYNGKKLISGELNGLFWAACYDGCSKADLAAPVIVSKNELLDLF